jgi:hypothetical protein
VGHLRAKGFLVKEENVSDIKVIKKRYGVPSALESCHTGLVEGYVVEGHVPADLIERLLREHPRVVGLAVPGMPAASPGMEGSGTPEPYEVFAFDTNGRVTVYARR